MRIASQEAALKKATYAKHFLNALHQRDAPVCACPCPLSANPPAEPCQAAAYSVHSSLTPLLEVTSAAATATANSAWQASRPHSEWADLTCAIVTRRVAAKARLTLLRLHKSLLEWMQQWQLQSRLLCGL